VPRLQKIRPWVSSPTRCDAAWPRFTQPVRQVRAAVLPMAPGWSSMRQVPARPRASWTGGNGVEQNSLSSGAASAGSAPVGESLSGPTPAASSLSQFAPVRRTSAMDQRVSGRSRLKSTRPATTA